MAYTPLLTLQESQALRRIAWALELPMTRTMSVIFVWLGNTLNREAVCTKCRDPSICEVCVFNSSDNDPQEAA